MATLSFLQSATDTTDTDVYTFASQNLGTASSDRHIIVTTVARKAGTGFTLLSVTIGGVSANIVAQTTNTLTNSDTAAMVIANVPSGTTGDIVITWSTTVLRCAVGVYHATGIDSITAYDSDSSTAADPTVNLDIPEGGFTVGGGLTAAATTASWTGLTENDDATLESFVTYTWASSNGMSLETGRTLAIDFASSTESAGVFASWSPSPSGTIMGINTITGLSTITF